MPCVHLLMPQAEHLLHGRDPGAGEALAVLAHPDGLQPFGHRPEHGAVAAAGAGQADGNAEEKRSSLVSQGLQYMGGGPETDSCRVFLPRIKVGDGLQRLRTTKQLVQKVDNVQEARSLGAVVLPTLKHELVDGRRTVHRSREPERLVDGLHDLMKRRSEDLKGH